MAKKKNRKRARSKSHDAPSHTNVVVESSSTSSSCSSSRICMMDLFVAMPPRQSTTTTSSAVALLPVGLVVKQLLDRLEATGFTHVALTHTVYGTPQADQDCAETAIPSTLWKSTITTTGTTTTSTRRRKIHVLRRLHAIVENASDVGFYAARKEENVILKDYDLISVAPRNDQAFIAACTSATACEIISLDYCSSAKSGGGGGGGGSSGLPFRIRAPAVKAAMERMVRFEIMYTPAILHANQRRCIIQTSRDFQMACRSLSRHEKQRSVIFSSGDRRRILKVAVDGNNRGGGNSSINSNDVGALALRNYGDLRNLFETVLGFNDHIAASALSSAGLGAIQQGHVRRFGNAIARTAIGNVAVETGDCRVLEFIQKNKPNIAKPPPPPPPSITSAATGPVPSSGDKERKPRGPVPTKRKASSELDTGMDDEEDKIQDGFISF